MGNEREGHRREAEGERELPSHSGPLPQASTRFHSWPVLLASTTCTWLPSSSFALAKRQTPRQPLAVEQPTPGGRCLRKCHPVQHFSISWVPFQVTRT